MRLRGADGTYRWFLSRNVPLRDEAGKVTSWFGSATDIQELKETGEALRVSEERYRLLVESARDYAIFMVDPSNTIIYWNSGAERVFGWTAEEALGQSGELIFTPEDRAIEREEKEIAIALRDGSATDRRWHLRKDGTRIWVDGAMHRLDDEETGALRGFAKVARDATDLHLAHEDLERRVKERTAAMAQANISLQAEIENRARLEQEILLISEREKRRIGQDLHDSLCQELAATAFLLESNAQRLAKTSRPQAKAFSEAAQRVNDNVGLARDLARGMHPVELTSGGLANALRELAYRTSTTKVRCDFVCPKRVRVNDEGVALSLYRIAQEALTNALKHGEPTTITIHLECVRKKLTLRVHDDGEGFGMDQPTTGLGLHIMNYRAQSVGGSLVVKSEKGDGTTVTCTVPVASCAPTGEKRAE